MAQSTAPSLLTRSKRLVMGLNWEMHVLQSGLHDFALRYPWWGLPMVLVLLVLVWSIYWVALPLLLSACAVAFVVGPIERWFRRSQ